MYFFRYQTPLSAPIPHSSHKALWRFFSATRRDSAARSNKTYVLRWPGSAISHSQSTCQKWWSGLWICFGRSSIGWLDLRLYLLALDSSSLYLLSSLGTPWPKLNTGFRCLSFWGNLMMMWCPLRLRGKTRLICPSCRAKTSMRCTLLKRLCCRLDFLQVSGLDCCQILDLLQTACLTVRTLSLSSDGTFHCLHLFYCHRKHSCLGLS